MQYSEPKFSSSDQVTRDGNHSLSCIFFILLLFLLKNSGGRTTFKILMSNKGNTSPKIQMSSSLATKKTAGCLVDLFIFNDKLVLLSTSGLI